MAPGIMDCRASLAMTDIIKFQKIRKSDNQLGSELKI